MAQLKNLHTGEVFSVAAAPLWNGGIWECGDVRFVDMSGQEYSVVHTPPQLTPVEFKMLWKYPERIAIRAARPTDPMLDDFYTIVDDPRLATVDLNLPSVQEAIQYALSTIAPKMAPPYGPADIEARYAQILTGTQV